MTYAEMLARLRKLLAQKPVAKPIVKYDKPDDRFRLETK